MKHNLTSAAKAFIEAKAAVEAAEAAKAAAEAALTEAFSKTGTDTTTVDGTKVTLVTSDRPSYDVDALRDMISPAALKKVTKVTVDSKKFRAAVEIGTIKPDVADAVTTVKTSQSIRVTVAKTEATTSKATKAA